jgi:hypothetical protein
MSWIDIVGYSAALAVLAAFCMSSIVPLRIVAILSNVLFALYGLSAHLYPVFLLHSILLPINVFKLTHVELLPRMAGLWSATASGQGRPFRSRAGDYSHSHFPMWLGGVRSESGPLLPRADDLVINAHLKDATGPIGVSVTEPISSANVVNSSCAIQPAPTRLQQCRA